MHTRIGCLRSVYELQTSGFTGKDAAPDMTTKGASLGLANTLIICSTIKGHIAILQGKLPADAPLLRTTDGGSKIFKGWPLTDADKRDVQLGQAAIDIYIQPGKEGTRSKYYTERHSKPAEGAAIVLGGGNQAFLGFVDVMHKLMMDNEPVVQKHHEAQVSFTCLRDLAAGACLNGV